MARYNNIPGVNVTVKDGQMNLTQDYTSNSMLIIGEVKAPARVGVPEDVVLVQNEVTLFENFGNYFYQGEMNPIAAEWYVAKQGGVENIYLLGLDKPTLKENFIYLQEMLYEIIADYQFSHIVVTSLYADEDIEGLIPSDFGKDSWDEVNGIEVYHTIRGSGDPSGVQLADDASETLTAEFPNGELSVTIDENMTDLNDLLGYLTDEFGKAANEALPGEVIFFEKDEDGQVVIKSNKPVILEGEEVLSGLGILTEDASELEGFGNPAVMLGNFAERQTLESEAVIVYIAARPPKTTNKRDIKETVERLVARKNEFSKHVQVIAGPQVGTSIPNSLRTQWLTGVTHYATLVESLAVQNAPTNQPLPNVSALRYDMSLSQLNDLTGNKYVTFRSKNNRIVVVSGVTTAKDRYVGQDKVLSDYTRLATLRATNYMVGAVRNATDKYIGRPNSFPEYNAMNADIKSVIDRSIELGIIQDAAYSIVLGNELDVTDVNLTILPQFETRKINVTIGMSTPEGFQALGE